MAAAREFSRAQSIVARGVSEHGGAAEDGLIEHRGAIELFTEDRIAPEPMRVDDEVSRQSLRRSAREPLVMLETRAGARHPVARLARRREPHHVERPEVGKIADGAGVVDADARSGIERRLRPSPERHLLAIDGRRARRQIVERPPEVRGQRSRKDAAQYGRRQPEARHDDGDRIGHAAREA